MVPAQEAIARLIAGNQRFISGNRSEASLLSHTKMKQLAEKGQKPFAIILTCSDSRSPVELIFDQGIGDLFVIRVAGNVVAPSLLASIEFAATQFGSPAIIVLGHTSCGAIGATIQHVQNPAEVLPSPHLEELIARIRPAVEQCIHTKESSQPLAHRATVANIERSKHLILTQSEIVRKLHDQRKLVVEGALLDISTGRVSFLDRA